MIVNTWITKTKSSCYFLNNQFKRLKFTKKRLIYRMNEHYAIKAKEDGYRCRSAYKLLQIDAKYHLIKPGMVVVDIGCAPGSWCQVLSDKISHDPNSYILGVDLESCEDVEGCHILERTDFTSVSAKETILNSVPRNVDLVLSDMAPIKIGFHELDSGRSHQLVMNVLDFGIMCSNPNITILCKLLSGVETNDVLNYAKNLYQSIKIIRPKSTRKRSSECFLLIKNVK